MTRVCILCLCCVLTVAVAVYQLGKMVWARGDVCIRPTVVIDAGHGGIDGGAVANDIIEKDINLAIAQKLDAMLRMGGFDTVMVRNEDISIHDDSADTVHEKKVSDLYNRLKLAQSTPNDIFVSIHQNKFPQSRYYGAQVFYGPKNEESSALAQTIQQNIASYLQPENERETKRATNDLFILYNVECPAVLVECGFLSNANEAALLATEEYQDQLAFIIYLSINEMYATPSVDQIRGEKNGD